MEEIKLDAQVRKEIGSKEVKTVRQNDQIPAILYGGDDQPAAIKIDRRTFERIMRQHKGQNVLFHLNIFENDQRTHDYSAIIKEEQYDPVSDKVIHVDFKRISLKEEVEVMVQIVSKGEAAGVKDGGSLEHVLWELDVKCLPTSIPGKILVDVTDLKIGETIHVKDLSLPEGVVTKHDPEDNVFVCVPPKEEKLEEEEEAGPTEPEVLKEKKKEEAGGEAS